MIQFTIKIYPDRTNAISHEFLVESDPNPPSQIEHELLAEYLTPKGMEVVDGILAAKVRAQRKA